MKGGVIQTNLARCRDCYSCVRACPVKAVRVQEAQAQVVQELCIVCGTCVRACPQGAKQVRDDRPAVQAAMAEGQPVIASVAPPAPALFDLTSTAPLTEALRALGFSAAGETAIGAEMVGRAHGRLLAAGGGPRPIIAAACPVVVNLVEMYYPDLIAHLAPIVSPMIAHGRWLRRRYGPEAYLVFIGPCLGKKGEIRAEELQGVIDAALTFSELAEWLAERGIELARPPEAPEPLEPRPAARLFPVEGGLMGTARLSTDMLADTLPECQVRRLAYATFSVLVVRHGRHAYLVEYDNPPLILIRHGQVVDLPMVEREVRGRSMREAEFDLQEGDYMALVSDGYVHAGVGGLYKLGWGWKNVAIAVQHWAATGGDAHQLTGALARTCLKLYGGQPGDDATAVGMKVRQAVQATILTGPPSRPELDHEVVQRFMAARGLKVICGGTTAQMVARELGRTLQVHLERVRPGRANKKERIPPTAELEGVDLVTEGIITLSTASKRLQAAETVHDLPPAHDGATELARVLLGADVLHFMVGDAINPYQLADVVRGKPMRQVYVEELISELEARGKVVTVEHL